MTTPGSNKQLQRDLDLLAGDLQTAQARLAELEQALRGTQDGLPDQPVSRFSRARAMAQNLLRPRRSAEATGLPRADPPNLGGSLDRPAGKEEVVDGEDQSEQEPAGASRVVQLLGGLTEVELASALKRLESEGMIDSELLVVTDCAALKTFNDYPCRFEYIPPREDWEKRLGRNGASYEDFVRRRLLAIAGTHGLTALRPEELIPSS